VRLLLAALIAGALTAVLGASAQARSTAVASQGLYEIGVVDGKRVRLPVEERVVALSSGATRALVGVVAPDRADRMELRSVGVRGGAETTLGVVPAPWVDLAWDGATNVAVTMADESGCSGPATECLTYSTTRLPDDGSKPQFATAAMRYAGRGGGTSAIRNWSVDGGGGSPTYTGPAAASLANLGGDPPHDGRAHTTVPVAVSFDGRAAAFLSSTYDSDYALRTERLFVVRPGRKPVSVGAVGNEGVPKYGLPPRPFPDLIAFSRDAGRVAYVPGDRHALCALTLSTGRSRCIAHGEGIRLPLWAPDGMSIAFVADGRTTTALRVVRVRDGRVRTLLVTPLDAAAVAWRGSAKLVVALGASLPR
jgi:hypothetical protein